MKIPPIQNSRESNRRSLILKLEGKGRAWLFTIFMLVLSVVILGYLVYQQKDILLNYKWDIQPIPILLSFLIFTSILLLVSMIWGWMMNALGSDISLKTHVRNYFISHVMRRIPGTLWYIAGRVYLYKKDGVSSKLTSMASGMEFAVILMSGVMTSLLFSTSIIDSYQINLFALVGVIALGFALINPKTMSFFFRLMKVEVSIFSVRDILGWLFAFVVVWILGGVVVFEITNSIYFIPIQRLGYVIGAWALVGVFSSLFVLLPSNIGVTEIGLSLLLTQIMPSSIAVIVAILTRLLLTSYEMIWAAIWLLIQPKHTHP